MTRLVFLGISSVFLASRVWILLDLGETLSHLSLLLMGDLLLDGLKMGSFGFILVWDSDPFDLFI
jgi:hypothetical protein